MPYPTHWLCAFGGQLNASSGGPEIWQCGVRGLPQAVHDYGSEEAVLDNITPLIKAWFSSADGHMRSDSDLRWVKLNKIGPDGKYVEPGTHLREFGAVNGGMVTELPQILTAAYSWETAVSRGPAARGRIFPPVALSAAASMRIASGIRDQLLKSAQKLLSSIGANAIMDPAEPSGGMEPKVVSSQGVLRDITGIRIGDVIDVQRRRKDQLAEVYTEGAPRWLG